MNTIYDVDYFIDKFQRIPHNKFATWVFRDYLGRRCFVGHCLPDSACDKLINAGVDSNNRCLYKISEEEMKGEFAESNALCRLLDPTNGKRGSSIAYAINNGEDPRYQQPTPKQRILAALRDIKAKIQKENNTGQREQSGGIPGMRGTGPELAAPSESKTERIVYVTVDKEVRGLQKVLRDN